VQYFSSLSREVSHGGSPEEAQVLSYIPPLVTREMNELLMKDITLEELEETIFQMKKGKAPSPNGFLVEFYQEF